MSINEKRWPESYGFKIYGDGPSYIIAVTEGSVAEKSGLRPGDQILQINDQDVGKYSSNQIIDYASLLAPSIPSLGVASRLKEVILSSPPTRSEYFGITLGGSFPVIIDKVEVRSPAFYTNLKSGDVLIKIDGKHVQSVDEGRRLLDESTHIGGAQVSVISVESGSAHCANHAESSGASHVDTSSEVTTSPAKTNYRTAGQQKAKDFLDEVKECLGGKSKEMQQFVAAIQNFSMDSDVEKFVLQVCDLMKHVPNYADILRNLRFFIPSQHKQTFNRLLENVSGNELQIDPQTSPQVSWYQDAAYFCKCNSSICTCSIALPSGVSHTLVQHDSGLNSYVESLRSVTVRRGESSFGLTLRGNGPIFVQEVEKGTPSDEANLKSGDLILAINGISLRNVSHAKAVALIQGSGSMPTLILQSSSGHLPQPVSSFHSPGYVKSLPVGEDSMLKVNGNCASPPDYLLWASEYVPDAIKINGKTFKEQVKALLNSEEQRTVKNALTDFYCSRHLEGLLYQLYPILHGPDTRRHVIWHYVLSCLSDHEREALQGRLLELNQITPMDKHLPSRRPAIQFSSQKNEYSKSESEFPTNVASLDYKPKESNTTPEPRSADGATPKRHRRRRTLGNMEYLLPVTTTSTELTGYRSTKSVSDVPSSSGLSSPTGNDMDSGFYDAQQQLARRRRRELSTTSRRRRSVTGAASTVRNADTLPLPNSSELAESQPTNLNTTDKSESRRGNRRRSLRKTVEIYTTTTTTTTEETIVNAQQGDKKSSSSKKKVEVKAGNQDNKTGKAETPIKDPSPVPASSVDDIVFEEYLPPKRIEKCQEVPIVKPQAVSKPRTQTLEEEQRIQIKNSNLRDNSSTSQDTLCDGGLSPASKQTSVQANGSKDVTPQLVTSSETVGPELSTFNDFSYDDPKKKGYLTSLKKKFTFSRPPKNTDTDMFLTELSTQFDEQMHLVGDVELEKEEKQIKYGEKWSYVPNQEASLAVPDAFSPPKEEEIVQQPHESLPQSLPPPEENQQHNHNASNSATQMDTAPVEKQRVRRRRRRNQSQQDELQRDRSVSNTDYLIHSERSESGGEATKRKSDPCPSEQTPVSPDPYGQDEVIYDVPKPVSASRRAHINTERRTRRTRAVRPLSMSAKRNSTELKMHVWMEDDLKEDKDDSKTQNTNGFVKLRSNSPVEQATFMDKARKRNYRVSGISIDMEDIFSEAEEDLHKRGQQRGTMMQENRSELADPDEVYAPLHEEVLALGLAYDEHEQDEQEEEPSHSSSNGTQSNGPAFTGGIPPPPSIPPPPPLLTIPPPPPLSPPANFRNTPPTSPVRLSVKRINWEKIEPVDLGNTVWGQLDEDFETINDVVKYLDLEEHFATKKAKIKKKKEPVKTDLVNLLAHKKAYNISILLAHLKLTRDEIYNCLLINGPEATRKRMDASHYKQLMMYAPDKDEIEKIRAFNDNPAKLNEADLLALKLINIPGYRLRLKALLFKHSFSEKEDEIKRNLEVIQRASNQLRKSRKLAKILEFVLAMGNYMNRGHNRVSKATGFRIHFLAEMENTKTSDNKLTFLHILARAVLSKFPEVLTFADELSDVNEASRIVYPAVLQELQELRRVWLDIRDHLLETVSRNKQDRFKIAMETCLVRTNGTLKRLEQLHAATVKDFNKVAQYFGENPKNIGMQQFFNIFDKFIRKFEKSSGEIRKLVKAKHITMKQQR